MSSVATPPTRILIVEDPAARNAALHAALEAAGYVVGDAHSQACAESAMVADRPTVVLTSLGLPEGDGVGVVRAAKAIDLELPVIAMTDSSRPGGMAAVVAAVQEGALDVVDTPVDTQNLLAQIEHAVERRRRRTDQIGATQAEERAPGAPRIVGNDPALTSVLIGLERAARTDATVLLEGESGTGKELFARNLHALSARVAGPFVAINCAAIPETLLESELFGHEKGAFTGATARKPGRFEVADGGTLFLDEIGDLPMGLQAKILRAVETRSFERVGGTQPLKVDVRLVAATNRDLRARVAAKEFREDLYFRLSVFPILIPPLRERPADVPLLTQVFLERCRQTLQKPTLRLSPAAEDQLLSHDWPGNVRELQNCIERAVILCDGPEILPPHLDLASGHLPAAPAADPWAAVDLSGSLAEVSRRVLTEVERRKILDALHEAGNDTGRVADVLLISHRTLMDKMAEHGIQPR